MAEATTHATHGQDRSRNEAPVTDEWLVPADSEIDPIMSVVMPTLNEEEGIAECIERVKRALEQLELPGEILISDSSTDRTPDIAREMGAIVVEPDGEGYGYAYRYAFEHVRGEYIVMGDADTTYDFEKIPELLEPVRDGDADICMGSRLDGEIRDGSMPTLHQYIGNPALTAFLNGFYGAGVSDAHSGFRVFTREALIRLDLQSDGMEFASEMIMDAGAKNLEIAEVPIVYHARVGEETLNSFRDGWRHVRFMLVNAPGSLFSLPGMAMGLAGLFVSALAVTGTSLGPFDPGIHSMVLGCLLVLCGFQVFNMGIFSTVAGNPIQRPTDPLTTRLTDGLQLEQGVVAGLAVFSAGTTYGGYLIAEWVASGFSTLPLVLTDVLAFTAIILGLQIVFSSFFLSTIADRSV